MVDRRQLLIGLAGGVLGGLARARGAAQRCSGRPAAFG